MTFFDRFGRAMALFDVGKNYVFGRFLGIFNLVLLVAIYFGGADEVGWLAMFLMGCGLVIAIFVSAVVYDRLNLFRASSNFNISRQTISPPWARAEFERLESLVLEEKK